MGDRPATQIWEAALGELQLQVSKTNYQTWLKDTVGVSFDDSLFVVGTPSAFASEWLKKQLSLVKKTLAGITKEHLQVEFRVVGEGGNGASTGESLAQEPPSGRSSRLNSAPNTMRFNPRYTFSTFIVGPGNRLAHAAAQGAAENPGMGYNPLFIYGGVGLGKTHLLHAVAHAAQERGRSILYVSCEQFTNDFINAIRERKNEEFRAKYRSVQVLLVDDIQFLGGKEQTQEEFFHTFNDLHSANRQIVITSDRSPQSTPLLEDRLRSRFEWGLIADIQPPDLETRLAILRAKVEEQGTAVPADILDFIAHRAQGNIRALEGLLNRVIAYARLTRAPMTLEMATQAIADMVTRSPRGQRLAPAQIIAAVARYFSLTPEALESKKRSKAFVQARQIAMYLLREETHRPLADIGRALGGRDHTTVLHGCEKITQSINSDASLRRTIMELREILYNSPS